MASRTSQYKFTIDMAYLDVKKNKSTSIKTECIKFLVIDHNYEDNHMPIIYTSLKLDNKLLDDMILNCNDNLFMIALNKYDDLSSTKQEIQCFRKKFTYFLPNNVNKNDSADYNDTNEDENLGNTYRDVTIGLMCIDHINSNKRNFSFVLKDVQISEAVKQTMDHFNNLIMEPIPDPTVIPQLMVPAKDSVSSMLEALNNIRVLYETPYRYYEDFNFTYLISSNGKAIKKHGETYSSIIINIYDILDSKANDIGVINDKSSQTYEVPVNYASTDVYDNTISNKSKSALTGMTSSGSKTVQLKNVASYSTSKESTIRLRNDNEGMLDNLKVDQDNNTFLVYIQKLDLDPDIFSINKRITINHIDRYQDHNGDYLMYRKRECYIREDSTFILNTMLNLKEISK
jgi:hypothetical protein